VGKHLSMVKENNMKIKGDLLVMGQKNIHDQGKYNENYGFFFYGTNNYPCMVKENRMKIIDDFLLWKKNWV